MSYKLIYTKKAISDIPKLKSANLADKAEKLCTDLSNHPKTSLSKALLGNLGGKRSIRINLQHRLVYEVLEKEKIVKILSLWGHY